MLLAAWLVLDRIYYRVFRGIMAVLYGEENIVVQWQIRAVDRFLIIILGVAWLVFMIVSEEKFRKASGNGTLIKIFARITGPLILVILLMDLILAYLQAFQLPWSAWLVMFIELVLGIGLTWLGKKKKISQSAKFD